MKKGYPLLISALFHILLIIILLLIDIDDNVVVKEEALEVKLIKKNEVVQKNLKGMLQSKVEIANNSEVISTDIEMPQKSVSLKETDYITGSILKTREVDGINNIKTNNIDEFEKSLNDLIPLESELLSSSEDNEIGIKWEGESRNSTTNTEIDFSEFPRDSFTGIGVTATFMVNSNGEVYNVEIMPPGSGSIEFDILVKQYISNFSFNKAENVSRGEVYIVYK